MHGANLTSHIIKTIQHPHALYAILQFSAERLRGNPADEDDRVIGAFEAHGQMMQDSAELAGWAAGDDDNRAGDGIDLFALLSRRGEFHFADAEDVGLADHFAGVLVVAIGEVGVDAADFHAHRAVDENRNRRDFLFLDELLHIPQDRLRSADGEAGDQQPAFVGDAILHSVEQLRADGGDRAVRAHAVGAFGDDLIDRHRQRVRIGKNLRVVSTDVGGEKQRAIFSRLGPFQNHIRRSENVPGVVEGEADAFSQIGLLLVQHGAEHSQQRRDVGRAIERLNRRIVGPPAAAVQILVVFLLNFCRVAQHDSRHGRRCGRAVNRPLESRGHRHRQFAAVIQMSMRQNNCVGRFDVVRQHVIQPIGFIARSLVHPHVQRDSQSVDFDQMARSGDGTVRSAELNSHCQSVVAPQSPHNQPRSASNCIPADIPHGATGPPRNDLSCCIQLGYNAFGVNEKIIHFGQFIRWNRINSGKTTDEFGRDVGLTARRVIAIEAMATPDVQHTTIVALARALGIEPENFDKTWRLQRPSLRDAAKIRPHHRRIPPGFAVACSNVRILPAEGMRRLRSWLVAQDPATQREVLSVERPSAPPPLFTDLVDHVQDPAAARNRRISRKAATSAKPPGSASTTENKRR